MMQAYKYEDIYNKLVQEKAAEAFEGQAINAESYKKILEAHASALYTPNFFIRIALGLLTVIAVLFSGLIFWLISGASSNTAIVALLMFLCIVCYAALELLTRSKQYYNAGLDNVLMSCSIIFLLTAFLIEDFPDSDIVTSFVMMLSCLWLCIRFTDAFMAMLSYASLYILVLLLFTRAGVIGEAVAPFALMFVSAMMYIIAYTLSKKESLLFYQFSYRTVKLMALVLFYVSANYFAVNEGSMQLLSTAVRMPATLSIVYWTLTVLIPVIYLIYGIKKKELMFIRTGFVLSILTILTIHYNYHFLPAEIDMLIGGLVLIAISYALIQYLRTPKHGFSFENTYRNKKDLLNAEALIIAQVFGKSNTRQKDFEFGGGSSGGGGATGDF